MHKAMPKLSILCRICPIMLSFRLPDDFHHAEKRCVVLGHIVSPSFFRMSNLAPTARWAPLQQKC
eukprot:1642121-Karenia_brevis.AAC.1